MPVAKIGASVAPNAMKADEGNDSLDRIINQAIGKEPLLAFSKPGDSPVQWIQLLHALDQQDLGGWPMLTSLKIEMQKCEKCSREFCSPINYRRHIRIHRRSLNVDKESHKNRDLLGAFWDTLSMEVAKEVASFEDVSLKEVSGSSILRELASSLRKPAVWTLPQVFVKAGSILLDIFQDKSSRLQITSEELFSILDDASERTFLCAGTAESVQKYVIEGDDVKDFELKNLVACASLLFEQKLVKAWLAEKDAEALRCHKLLVEEEEAAQKRQAQLLERKKQKKLRQKEKAKEQSNSEEADTSSNSVDEPVSTEISISPVPSDPIVNGADTPAAMTYLDQIQYPSKENDVDIEAQFDLSNDHVDMGSVHNVDLQAELAIGRRQFATNRWQVPKSHRNGRNGFHDNQKRQTYKLEPIQKQGPPKDRSTLANGGKVWTRKSKVGIDDESSAPKLQKVATNEVNGSNCELMFGTIPVLVSTAQQQYSNQGAPSTCSSEHAIAKNNIVSEKIPKLDAAHHGTNQEVVKLWRPISQSETRGPLPVYRDNQGSEETVSVEKVDDRTVSNEICLQSSAADINDKYCSKVVEKPGEFISVVNAKAFLAQRWKEAISADHVKLILSPEPEPTENPKSRIDCLLPTPTSDVLKPSTPGDVESQLAGVAAPVSYTKGKAKGKFRKKREKGATKIKYIPKQKVVT